jgi:hypothetical protein
MADRSEPRRAMDFFLSVLPQLERPGSLLDAFGLQWLRIYEEKFLLTSKFEKAEKQQTVD